MKKSNSEIFLRRRIRKRIAEKPRRQRDSLRDRPK